MNECFLYLSSQPTERGGGGRERWREDERERERRQLRSSFSPGLMFSHGSLPRQGDNGADTYCVTKLFLSLPPFINFFSLFVFLS